MQHSIQLRGYESPYQSLVILLLDSTQGDEGPMSPLQGETETSVATVKPGGQTEGDSRYNVS